MQTYDPKNQLFINCAFNFNQYISGFWDDNDFGNPSEIKECGNAFEN